MDDLDRMKVALALGSSDMVHAMADRLSTGPAASSKPTLTVVRDPREIIAHVLVAGFPGIEHQKLLDLTERVLTAFAAAGYTITMDRATPAPAAPSSEPRDC